MSNGPYSCCGWERCECNKPKELKEEIQYLQCPFCKTKYKYKNLLEKDLMKRFIKHLKFKHNKDTKEGI